MYKRQLLYSLITNVRDNINRNQTDLKLFEISKTFKNLGAEKDGLAIEDLKIGIILSGREDKNLWNQSKTDYNFYDLKGYLEFLLEKLNVTRYSLTRLKNPNFHPGASAETVSYTHLETRRGRKIYPEYKVEIFDRIYVVE